MSILSENIKRRRRELGFTQEELANTLGYSDRSAISKIEKGEVDLQQAKVYAFAKALYMEPAELAGWDNENPSREERELMDLFHSMSTEGQAVAMNVLRGLATQYKKSAEGK